MAWRLGLAAGTLATTAAGKPILQWHDAHFALALIDSDHLLPFEMLRDGEIEAGAEEFRLAAGSWPLGSDIELAINRLAYQALGLEQIGDAVLLSTLNTELVAGSANAWDGLGDGLKAAGRLEEAREAYLGALARSPAFAPSLRNLADLEG